MELFKAFALALVTTGVKISLLSGIFLVSIGLFVPIYNKLFKNELKQWKRMSLYSVLIGLLIVFAAALLCVFYTDGLSVLITYFTEIFPLLKYGIGGFIAICLIRYIYTLVWYEAGENLHEEEKN